MSLRLKIILPYLLLLTAVAGLFGFLIHEFNIQERLLKDASGRAAVVTTSIQHLGLIREEISFIVAAQRFEGYQATLRRSNELNVETDQVLDELRQTMGSSEGRRLLEFYAASTAGAATGRLKLLEAKAGNVPEEEVRRRYLAWEIQIRLARYRLRDLQAFTNKELTLAIHKVEDLRSNVKTALFALTLLAFVIGVGAWFNIQRGILSRLMRLKDDMLRVGSGQLEHTVRIEGGDELAELAGTFDALRSELRIKILQLAEVNGQLEERVQHRTAELVAANRELEAFSYSVSHDLRAPLRGIDGFSDVLLRRYGPQLDEQGQKFLQRIKDGADRMSTLIDDLLRLSRLTRMEMKRQTVDLTAIAQQVIEELRMKQPERQVQIEIEAGMRVTADQALIASVVENLLGNAWKFTGHTVDARITFSSERKAEETIFTIRDNGAGFDMEYQSKLFGAFQRLHHQSEFPGTGVGLASVLRVIRRHGGRVWAESSVGQGATFYFSIPHAAE